MSIHQIHQNHGFIPHMTATTWQHRLDVAYTPEELVDIARDFIASFSPYELYALPEHCRPPPKIIAEDISSYAYELVRHECSAPDTAQLVHKLARFFSHASTRLAQLTARDQHGNDFGERQSA